MSHLRHDLPSVNLTYIYGKSPFVMFTTIHYWSWHTEIHNIQQPKLREEAGLGRKICTVFMTTGECSLFSESWVFAACFFHKAFTNVIQLMKSSGKSQTLHAIHAWFEPEAWNRRFESSFAAAELCRGILFFGSSFTWAVFKILLSFHYPGWFSAGFLYWAMN